MLCYGFPWPRVLACHAKVSSWVEPLLHLVGQITFCVFPHTTEQDSQLIAALISKQAIPYQTRGDTCCPGVSTPKIRSLPDSSMTNHIPWRIPAISTNPTHAQAIAWSTDISTDGKPQLSHKDTSPSQHHKDGRLVQHSWLQG
jgi:hypothetical protein